MELHCGLKMHSFCLLSNGRLVYDKSLPSPAPVVSLRGSSVGVVHILYNALEGEGWSAICYMRYIREGGCFC